LQKLIQKIKRKIANKLAYTLTIEIDLLKAHTFVKMRVYESRELSI
jgi:hypothetical protein